MTHQADLPPLTLVFLIDGLAPNYWGAYGCSWTRTPALDRLAASSILFENAIADSVCPRSALHAFLAGRHVLSPAANPIWSPLHPVRVHARCILVSDDVDQFERALADSLFDDVIRLPAVDPFLTQAGSVTHFVDTHLGNCFAQLCAELSGRDWPLFAVIHLSSLTRIWDAPGEARQKYCDPEDPPPGDWVVPPDGMDLGDFPDPDDILGVTRALAAQIECLDHCLEILLEELDSWQITDSSLIAISGLRGFPAGWHGIVGPDSRYLFSDTVDVAMMIKPAIHAKSVGSRDHRLIQPSSLLALLAERTGLSGQDGQVSRHQPQSLILSGQESRAIRTLAWFLVETGQQSRLYVKPDDRWDVNPVEDRCRDVVKRMQEAYEATCRSIQSGQTIDPPLLASDLTKRVE